MHFETKEGIYDCRMIFYYGNNVTKDLCIFLLEESLHSNGRAFQAVQK